MITSPCCLLKSTGSVSEMDDIGSEDDDLVVALTPAQVGSVIALIVAVVVLVRALRRSAS